MSILLSLETSTETASAALLVGEQMIALDTSGAQTHSQTILPMVQRLLAHAGIALSQCDAIAFGAGPGSFTGVRTACGLAQGLAFGANLPVIPISTLQAMAHACHDATGVSEVVSLLDARMDEIYWARYHFSNGWETSIEPTLSPASAVAISEAAAICGNGFHVLSRAKGILHSLENVYPEIMPHAKSVARLAHIELIANRQVAPRDAQPIYLRNKVALTTSERAAKTTA